MRYLITIFYSILTISTLSSQPIIWQRYYDGPNNKDDYGHKVCKADGDNFYLIGSSTIPPSSSGIYIIKINPLGQPLWTRLLYSGIVGNTGVRTDDDGCVISGTNDTSFTLKINKDGDVVWYKTYIQGFPQIYDIIRTSDNGFIACGEIGLQAGHIFKTDSVGNMQWHKTYPSGSYKWFNNIIRINDGYFLVGHDVDTSIVGEGTLTKIDSIGNIKWEKRYSISDFSFFTKRIIKNGNIYKLFGDCASRNMILTVDSVGVIIDTSIIYPPSGKVYQFNDVFFHNNKYITSSIIQRTSLPDTPYVELRILDENENTLNVNQFISGDYSSIESTVSTSNGDYLFTGYMGRFDVNHSDVYAIRTDSTLSAPPVGIISHNTTLPNNFKLYQNYPNPFNPSTTISFEIKKKSEVKLSIYDINGKLVEVLLNRKADVGKHQAIFSAGKLPSGIYFYSLFTDGILINSKKMLLIK